jgi:hypothetical protein
MLLGALAVFAPPVVDAHRDLLPCDQTGSLVSASVEVEGRPTPLYPAPDGSGRFYLEALPHARYTLRLANNTRERFAVLATVDGLNVISGERDRATGPDGRMYVLGPWESMAIRGWRTSLAEVRTFTFVDEQRSYAARSGKANAKMGWIELAVYRERRPYGHLTPEERNIPEAQAESARGQGGSARERSSRAPSAGAPAAEARGDDEADLRTAPRAEAPRSYPGTGWGAASSDPAVVVDFDPQPYPAERTTLRYEYASGLRALGIDLRRWAAHDRLRERDRGEGFARPPAW